MNRSQLAELRALAEAEPLSRFSRRVLTLLDAYQTAVADCVRLAGELGQWQTVAERFLKVIDGKDAAEVNAAIACFRQLATGAACDPSMPDPYVAMLQERIALLTLELDRSRKETDETLVLSRVLTDRCARLAERRICSPSAN